MRDIVSHHIRHMVGIGVTRATVCCARRGGLPAHVDGREGRDWVVTPRRGKAVEINALWHKRCGCSPNGVREGPANEQEARRSSNAEQVRPIVQSAFWYARGATFSTS